MRRFKIINTQNIHKVRIPLELFPNINSIKSTNRRENTVLILSYSGFCRNSYYETFQIKFILSFLINNEIEFG